MFTPPAEPVTARGGAAGILSAYWWGALAAAIVAGGLFVRGSSVAAAMVVIIGLLLLGVLTYIARGTRIEVTSTTLSVRRRFKPVWTVEMRDFNYIVENIPSRPRAPALAGWTFKTHSGKRCGMEIAMFSRDDRRMLRRLFADVIVDADAGMRRR